ncbi:uncharacterized protein DNG_09236 [Cephalotrichum gorgonifer]|uniref:Uncharacterized protein n=1 Tax=Cephalotrichum gorgonifer TaxID=2041049 RepID=A0AAE8N5A7_9PEZI|nr:uncharacterized protein DNG_09236 [Cephalotrichum gorgonifer]
MSETNPNQLEQAKTPASNETRRVSDGDRQVTGHRDQESYYDPATGAYSLQFDYATVIGVHHRSESTDAQGVYRERDVDIRDDGSKHVHSVCINPNTRTKVERDYEVQEDEY